MTNVQKLDAVLSLILGENQRLDLGNDIFLLGDLDGSDKVYGWIKVNNSIYVETRNGYYSNVELEKEAIKYIFKLSEIFNRLKMNLYIIEDLDEYEINNLKFEL